MAAFSPIRPLMPAPRGPSVLSMLSDSAQAVVLVLLLPFVLLVLAAPLVLLGYGVTALIRLL